MRSLFILSIILLMAQLINAQDNNQSFIPQNNNEFAKTLITDSIIVIDVRTPKEFSEGHLPGAINIDVNNPNFQTKIKALDAKTPVALYCRSGKRSKIAANLMVKEGFKVYELDNGIENWNGLIIK